MLNSLGLVKAIAIRVHESLPVHLDLDDLVHAGILGLFDAADKYDPNKNVEFSIYAKHRIKGAIMDSLRKLDWASRDLRRRQKEVEAITQSLACVLQRHPNDAEVAERLGVTVERYHQIRLDLCTCGPVSADSRTDGLDHLPAPDFPSKPETQPDRVYARRQMGGFLTEAIRDLPKRYQKVVSLYYEGELNMKEIGGLLGINESRVSQIHKCALAKMAVTLRSNGIDSAHAFAC